MDAETRIKALEDRVTHLETLLTKAQDAMKRFESHPMFGAIVRMFKD